MRVRLASVMALPFLLACGAPSAPPASPGAPAAGGAATAGPAGPASPGALSPHARFGAFASRFLEGYLERFPTDATLLGNHAQEISPVGEGLLLRILGRVQRHAIREPEQTFTGRMRRIAAPLVLPCRDAPSSIDVMRREA